MAQLIHTSVNGVPLAYASRYKTGQKINAAEAEALNNTLGRNMTNNIRSEIKELIKKHGVSSEETRNAAQALLDELAKTYDFGQSRTRSRFTDPLQQRIYTAAMATLTGQIKTKKNMTVAQYIEAIDKEKGEGEGKKTVERFIDDLMSRESVVSAAKAAYEAELALKADVEKEGEVDLA